ncbi:alpha-L-fucosidase [uncultured Draconibacterium sp.]|uniref:alpha-L-fucosidase n=1 Tax=uncultured Draconibacterium sp. TaxID=1573823 RepID=UPI003261936F
MRTILIVAMFILAIACTNQPQKQSFLPDKLPPIPEVPELQPENSVPRGDASTFAEVKLANLPVAPGPYEPTWESIEANYPGQPNWLREAKFGIWVHFGPQAAGESGDWYARRLYDPKTTAYKNHLEKYGHPSEVGYKEVLRDWNPDQLNPAELTKIYQDAGARYLVIQGVHHDNYDLWDSKYQPWNSVNLGPKRDLMGEWEKACRENNMHFGITFHHEYTWWWWQTAFGSDTTGQYNGIPYDANLTLADGKGKWWEGYDPRMLYGINLREYDNVPVACYTGWNTPGGGIFTNHIPYAKWYATQWALRMMDAIDKYNPDFIYTDGTKSQPFCAEGTGSGLKADAMQRVIAYYYNQTLARRGDVDVFSIVKFRHKTNGTVTTEEFGAPEKIKNTEPWIAEIPVGDWYYGPGFTYDAGMVIRYLIEAIARDGNVAICVSPLPNGALDEGSRQMLKNIGNWMRINGEAVYGSKAWAVPGEGEIVDGKLKMLPSGKLGKHHAEFKFNEQDFRFTVGKSNEIYAFCMTVPQPETKLQIKSLATGGELKGQPVKTVRLLGFEGELEWSQQNDGLYITCPEEMDFATSVVFEIK